MSAAITTMNLCQPGDFIACTAATDLFQLEGVEMVFDDLDWSVTGPMKPHRTYRKRLCRLVRNVSGVNLLPKRTAVYATASGLYGNRVDGYGSLTAQRLAGVIDEWLPSTGVPNLALFWITVEGPSLCLTDIASLGSATIAVGENVVGLTAATSQATTAGRIREQDLSGATAILADHAVNRIGVAMSAATTGQTNADILVDIRRQQ